MLLPKDLLEDLEGGDRTEEIIKQGLEIKLKLTISTLTATHGSFPTIHPAQLQQAQLQQARPMYYNGNSSINPFINPLGGTI